MKALVRDLGLMEYGDCWALQQRLFDQLLARKRGAGAGKGAGAATGAAGAAVETAGAAVGTTGAAVGTTGAAVGTAGAATGAAGAVKDTGAAVGTAGAADTAEAATRLSAMDPLPEAGVILTVEHPPVYTLGKSGHAENLLIPRAALEALGARFFHIDRGGDITFHGPGQLVCYPILDLERLGIGLRDYIDALEEAVIRTVGRYGIEAGRIAGASGVWLGEGITPRGTGRQRKICAIGVRSSRYVTMHGLALNVATDLEWFSRINPCGFTDRGVTSIERECGRSVPMDEVKALLVNFLSEILNVEIYK